MKIKYLKILRDSFHFHLWQLIAEGIECERIDRLIDVFKKAKNLKVPHSPMTKKYDLK